MKGINHHSYLLQLLWSNKICLIDYKSGAELNLLYQKAFNILFVDSFLIEERLSGSKFIHQSCGINYSYHIVQDPVLYKLQLLGNRHRLADSAGLNEDVVIESL